MSFLHRLPLWARNVAVTAYGARLARKRYSSDFQQYLQLYLGTQWLDPHAYRDLQNNMLRDLLREAYDGAPFYRQALAPVVRNLQDFTIDDLSSLPLLEKETVRERTCDMINRSRVRQWGHIAWKTSGTTGNPFHWPFDWDSMRRNLAIRERFYRWQGITRYDVSARFTGRPVSGNATKPPYWVLNRTENQWFFSTFHLREATFPDYVAALNRIKPVYLDGFPSAFHPLAKWILADRSPASTLKFRPCVIITTAETLGSDARRDIEQAFGCRVADYYSSSEGAPYITELVGEDGLLVNPESGIVEFLEGTDKAELTCLGAHTRAEMVVTSFIQRSLPLIRYRIGDSAILDSNRTGKTRVMPRIVGIAGRNEDLVIGGDGRLIGIGLDRLVKGRHHIHSAQLVQHADRSITLRVVPSQGFDEIDRPVIEKLFPGVFGPDIRYRIVTMNSIPRGPNGKLRGTIREGL